MNSLPRKLRDTVGGPPPNGALPDPSAPLAAGFTEPSSTTVARAIANFGSRLAVVGAETRWTYTELDALIEGVASQLEQAGVVPGDVIAIHAARSAWLIPAILGVWRVRAAFTIVDSAHPAARVLSGLEQIPVKAWIDMGAPIESALSQYLANRGAHRIQSGQTETCNPSRPHPLADDRAYIAFTSGSTGKPRGVLGTHGPLGHFMAWHTQRFGLGPEDRFAMLSGLSHDPLMRDVLAPLSIGGCVIIPHDDSLRDSKLLAQWMAEHSITVAHLTPSLAQILALGLEARRQHLTGLRYLFLGGEALTVRLADRCLALAPESQVVNFYGATETPQAMGHYVYDPHEGLTSRIVPVGCGIDNVQLLVITTSQTLAKVGEAGEVWIRTPHLAAGYWSDSAATAERFTPNPFTKTSNDLVYRTGDTGYYLPSGAVVVTGRKDAQLKIAGHRIEPGDVEAALELHPQIQRAVVTVHSGPSGADLAAYCVETNPGSVTTKELRAFLNTRLPHYMMPRRILVLEGIPTTRNGKVDSAALQNMEPGEVVHGEFQSELEAKLASLWTQVLRTGGAGRDDDFFAQGGSSLAAAMLVALIEQRLGARVSLASLIQAPTPASMASAIEGQDLSRMWEPLVQLTDHEEGAKQLFCVHGIGGNVITFQALAQHLGPHGLTGLQAVGLDGVTPADPTIEAMARRYVGEILRSQPQGPFELAGFSAGGLIALEMAQILTSQGHTVQTVILFDTKIVPQENTLTALPRKLLRNVSALARMPAAGWRGFFKTKWLNARGNLRLAVAILQGVASNKPQDTGSTLQRIETGMRIAERKYQPRKYAGRVVLFRTHEGTSADPARIASVWRRFLPTGLEIVEAAGSHDTMLQTPNVDRLADQVRKILEPERAGVLKSALLDDPLAASG